MNKIFLEERRSQYSCAGGVGCDLPTKNNMSIQRHEIVSNKYDIIYFAMSLHWKYIKGIKK